MNIDDQVRYKIRNQIWSGAEYQTFGETWHKPRYQVIFQIRNQIRPDSLIDQVRNQLEADNEH